MPPKYSTINARVETVQTAASYRGPWKRGQRCSIVVRAFYEWQVQADGRISELARIGRRGHSASPLSTAFEAGIICRLSRVEGGHTIQFTAARRHCIEKGALWMSTL